MATGGIPERRLKPVWDAIESRQFKPALKLVSALHSKHPDLPYALALKALVLERLGKGDEALALCRQARDMMPVDDLVLSTLQIVYQRLGYLDEAVLCYENACSKCPGNMELLISLFYSYVRQYNFVKQQQTAMRIYKMAGEEKYLLWAVCSIYLQVGPLNPAGAKLMTLAEALLKKRIESNGTIDVEALRVYISLLQDQGKYELALEVLSGHLGGLFTIKLDLLRLQGELLLRLRRYHEATAIFKEILSASSDDWSAITHLIDAALETSGATKSERYAQCEKLLDMFRDLQSAEHGDATRGLWLATVEIESRRLMCRPSDCETNRSMLLATAILEYFKRFGHLASFLLDVRGYLLAVEERARVWLIDQMGQACSDPDGLRRLRKKIGLYQVIEHNGSEFGILEVAGVYKENLPLSAELDPQESICGEELLEIIANYLLKVYMRSKQLGFLLEAVLVLEYGLSLRRFNSRYRLMLVSLYSCIFCVTLARNWFKSLEIKNILLEAASHHILPTLLVSPHWRELESALQESIRFHEDYQIEASEAAILAYKHCNYSKILEFVALKERLEHSHHHLLARVELALVTLKQLAEKLDEAKGFLEGLQCGKEAYAWCTDDKLSELTFNEDFETRPWWTPVPDENLLTDPGQDPCNSTDEARKSRWLAYVQRRCLLPRLLFLAFNGNGGKSSEEFNDLLACYLKGLGLTPDSVGSPSFFETSSSIQGGANTAFTISLLWLAGQLNAPDVNVDGTLRWFVVVGEVFKAAVGRLCAAGVEDVIGLGTKLSCLFMLLFESLAWFTLCVQAWSRRLQPAAKKKKKADNAGDEKNAKIMNGIRTLVACICSELEVAHGWLVKRSQDVEVDKLMCLLHGGGGDGDEAVRPGQVLRVLEDSWDAAACVSRIVDSQRSFLCALQDVCSARLKFLKSLKL